MLLLLASCGLCDAYKHTGSDISTWHKIRVVPTVMFYDEGAVVSEGLLCL